MIVRLALRSLAVRRVRTALLACGFGLGIAVMAELLGVGEVILEQARSPALQGGGDLVLSGPFGAIESARFVMTSVLGAPDFRQRIAVVSPSDRATLYLIEPKTRLPVTARGGVPSLEKAIGDREVADQAGWTDTPSDSRWARPDPADVLRGMDRFHPTPVVPEFAASWAEWLYFNGRTPDGRVRFYLTFIVTPSQRSGVSTGSVRLQLERDGQLANYSSAAEIDDETVLANAPDLDIGGNRVRLQGLTYRIQLQLRREDPEGSGNRHPAPVASGELTLAAVPGRSLAPVVVRGARDWLTGYVVPVLSGAFTGRLDVEGEPVIIDRAIGYHDHNWGFWQGVRWQWGQVAHDDLSFVYGRVFPPASVADPERMPGVLSVLGSNGPLGVATDVTITERSPTASPGSPPAPDQIDVTARGPGIDLTLHLSIDGSIRTQLGLTRTPGSAIDFLQLAGVYHVAGRIGDRSVDFTARGAAETFRPR